MAIFKHPHSLRSWSKALSVAALFLVLAVAYTNCSGNSFQVDDTNGGTAVTAASTQMGATPTPAATPTPSASPTPTPGMTPTPSPTPGATPAPTPAGTVRPSAGCSKTVQPKGQSQKRSTDGQNRARTYQIVVPNDYSGRTPLALVLGYHGNGGTGQVALDWGVKNATGAASAAIFVGPDGIQFMSYGVGWDDNCSGYDMPFFDHILAEVSDAYCIDLNRVFVYGFSWGGDHALGLACCRGDKIRGISIHAASDEFGNANDESTYVNLKNGACPVRSQAAVRFTHARDGEDGAYAAPLFATTSALLRKRINVCNGAATATNPSPCVSYGACTNKMIECAYPNLGHTLPPNYGQETWDFFKGL